MTLLERELKVGKLQKLYEVVKKNLENRSDWQAWKGNNWNLKCVGILNTGDLLAIVNWHGRGEQHIGVSWENAFEDANINEL